MSATVAAALKKIAVAILTDKNCERPFSALSSVSSLLL